MNCKQGDVAIVVGSSVPNSPNLGKIVTCLELVPTGILFSKERGYIINANWIIDCALDVFSSTTGEPMGKAFATSDEYLRPFKPLQELEALQKEIEHEH